MITLILNGISIQSDAKTLSQLMKNLPAEFNQQRLTGEQNPQLNNFAIAVNHVFVPKTDYSKTFLKQADQIELVVPMQGG